MHSSTRTSWQCQRASDARTDQAATGISRCVYLYLCIIARIGIPASSPLGSLPSRTRSTRHAVSLFLSWFGPAHGQTVLWETSTHWDRGLYVEQCLARSSRLLASRFRSRFYKLQGHMHCFPVSRNCIIYSRIYHMHCASVFLALRHGLCTNKTVQT